jgi:hypothetical protein
VVGSGLLSGIDVAVLVRADAEDGCWYVCPLEGVQIRTASVAGRAFPIEDAIVS